MSPVGPRALRRGWPWVAGLALIVIVAGAAYGALHRSGNVSNPGVEFSAKPAPAPKQPKSKGPGDPVFEWPVFGYDKARTRTLELSNPSALHPPYKEIWARKGSTLIEFPPVMGMRSLFVLKNNGRVFAISRRTGQVLWGRKIGELAAASPAYAHGTLYCVLLKGLGGSEGRVIALSARDGHYKWSRRLPSRAESSPLIDRGRLFFGTEDGTVYALRAKDGSVVWTYKAHGAVKGGIAEDQDRNLYFGDYGGHVQSVRARDGSVRWDRSVNSALGIGSHNFYSTPAVAFDRVYIGNTDGNVYSFGTRDGALAWRRATGRYVYGSPAVTSSPYGKPTVYIGGYDGNFYALNARTGEPRWIHHAEGPISGGSVVIGDMVFYSTLKKTTTALGVSTGRVVWHTNRGAFNPVVSDGKRLYLVGFAAIFGLVPKSELAKEGSKAAGSAAGGKRAAKKRGAHKGTRPAAKKTRRSTRARRSGKAHRSTKRRRSTRAHRAAKRRPLYVICLKHRRGLCVHAIVRHHRGKHGRRIR